MAREVLVGRAVAHGRNRRELMLTEIRIYVEGGGKGDTRARIRRGFNTFFQSLVAIAREREIGWEVIPCGSRESTFDDFKTALKTHADALNLLLVDSDGPLIAATPSQHLKQYLDRRNLQKVSDEQCHVMVQMFEAWLVADLEALKKFYGRGFNAKAIPRNPIVEEIDKTGLETSLKKATSKTQKGKYHKIKHAAELLERIDPSKVKAAAPHCRRLFETLEAKMAD